MSSYIGEGPGLATRVEFIYTALASQATFSGNDDNGLFLNYTVGLINVFVNGSLQTNGVDYIATNGTSVVFASGLSASDVVTIEAYGAFSPADTYTKAEAVAKSGDTMSGALGVPAGTLATPAIHISGDTDTGLYSPGANQLDLGVGGVKALGIDSNGIVVKPKVPAFAVSQTSWTISGSSPYYIGDAARGSVNIETNNGSHFSTTLGKFTAPVDGIYVFSASFMQTTGSSANPYMYLMKNSISIGRITYNYYNIHLRTSVTTRIFCSAGDYIQAGVYRDTIAISYPMFSGHLIG